MWGHASSWEMSEDAEQGCSSLVEAACSISRPWGLQQLEGMAVCDLPFQETRIQAPRMKLGRNIRKVGVNGLYKSATEKFAFLESTKTWE